MWGQTIFPGSPPLKSHVYICCIIYLFCIIPSFLHLFWNNRSSYGCVYAQIRSGLGMHLGTYSNQDTVLFLLIVPIKGRFV